MLLFRIVNGILGSLNNDGELFNRRSTFTVFLYFSRLRVLVPN